MYKQTLEIKTHPALEIGLGLLRRSRFPGSLPGLERLTRPKTVRHLVLNKLGDEGEERRRAAPG